MCFILCSQWRLFYELVTLMKIHRLINNKFFQLCFLFFLSPPMFFLILIGFLPEFLFLPPYIRDIFGVCLCIGICLYPILFSFFTSFVALKICSIKLKLTIFIFLCFMLLVLLQQLLIPFGVFSRYIYTLLAIILIAVFIKIIYSIKKIKNSTTEIEFFVIASFGMWLFHIILFIIYI